MLFTQTAFVLSSMVMVMTPSVAGPVKVYTWLALVVPLAISVTSPVNSTPPTLTLMVLPAPLAEAVMLTDVTCVRL